MSSIVQICNSALVTLGAETINSLTEGSTEANVCNAKWNFIRKSQLRLHPWNFAIGRTELAASVTTPTFRYTYQYPLPSDNLRLLRVYMDGDYKVEQNNILTDETSCKIKYIKDITDVTKWDSLFTEVVIGKLALELAYTLPATRTMIDAMAQLYERALQNAKNVDGSEDYPDDFGQFESELITTRY